MFGIGLPEMLLIMALALIVIGPDKLPDLARSMAKGLLDLKKTAESLKSSLAEESKVLQEIRPELEEAAKSLKNDLLDSQERPADSVASPADPAAMAAAAYEELLKETAGRGTQQQAENDAPPPEGPAEAGPGPTDMPAAQVRDTRGAPPESGPQQ
jgi:sec-independent protein translocase protein TatB